MNSIERLDWYMDNYVAGMEEFLNSGAADTSKIPYKRVLAVGDCHGHFTEFMSLYNKLDVSDDDLLILLGDLITGGNENLPMIRWAMSESRKSNVVVLMGNSEDDFLRENEFRLLISNGKVDSLRFFSGRFGDELRAAAEREPQLVEQVIDFLKNLPTHFMLDGFFFCHAGINPKKPFTNQPKTTLLCTRPKNFAEEYLGKTLIVVGHTHVQNFVENCTVPLKWPNRNILLLDTGAKKNGLISCTDVLSGRYWQSDI